MMTRLSIGYRHSEKSPEGMSLPMALFWGSLTDFVNTMTQNLPEVYYGMAHHANIIVFLEIKIVDIN